MADGIVGAESVRPRHAPRSVRDTVARILVLWSLLFPACFALLAIPWTVSARFASLLPELLYQLVDSLFRVLGWPAVAWALSAPITSLVAILVSREKRLTRASMAALLVWVVFLANQVTGTGHAVRSFLPEHLTSERRYGQIQEAWSRIAFIDGVTGEEFWLDAPGDRGPLSGQPPFGAGCYLAEGALRRSLLPRYGHRGGWRGLLQATRLQPGVQCPK